MATYCVLGYVQGMNDLLAPILMIMDDEVDAFWCFASYMKRMVGNPDENTWQHECGPECDVPTSDAHFLFFFFFLFFYFFFLFFFFFTSTDRVCVQLFLLVDEISIRHYFFHSATTSSTSL